MPSDPNCVFCRVLAGTLPAVRIAESPLAYAFLDIGPVARGHTLVVPRDHYETIADMPPEVLTGVYGLAARLAPALMVAVGAEGLNVLQNVGRCAGQVVSHVHVHLVPRCSDDGLDWPWPAMQADADELKRVAESIISNLDAS